MKFYIKFILIITIFILLISFFLHDSDDGARPHGFVVTAVQGEARVSFSRKFQIGKDKFGRPIRMEAKSHWIPLKKGMKLQPGARIHTPNSDSQADFLFQNGMGIRVAPESLVTVHFSNSDYPEQDGQTHSSRLTFPEFFLVKIGFAEENKLEATSTETTPSQYKVHINSGSILSHVVPDTKRLNVQRRALTIQSPVATIGIRGTTFSVSFDAGQQSSNVEVLEGTVQVQSEFNKNLSREVTQLKKTDVSVYNHNLDLEKLSKYDIKTLEEAMTIPMKYAEDINFLAPFNVHARLIQPILNKLLTMVTAHEMREIIDYVRFLNLLWKKVPDTIHDIDLMAGNYNDPWDNPYLYAKLGEHQVVLISSGADGIPFSEDDIVMSYAQ